MGVETNQDDVWQELWAQTFHTASRLVEKLGSGGWDPEDLAQETLFLYLRALRAGHQVGNTRSSVEGTLRHLIADGLRGRLDDVGPTRMQPLDDGSLDLPSLASGLDPEMNAVLKELWTQAPALMSRLPPPFLQIAKLQYLRGWSRRDISTWLRAWRPVGEQEVRRLLSRSHALLSALGRGRPASQLWDEGVAFSRKNPWLTTPPHHSCDYYHVVMPSTATTNPEATFSQLISKTPLLGRILHHALPHRPCGGSRGSGSCSGLP